MSNARATALEVVPNKADDEDGIDISEFEALVPKKPNTCWFAVRLNDEQRAKVSKARRSGIQYDTIHLVLKNWGIDAPNTSSMGHHFLGRCGCANVED